MGKKQTYATVMKDLTAKKAKYEDGLKEAQRVGNPSGVTDYKRRLAKINAGMDQLFQAQESGKMAKGGYTGMPKYEQGGPTNTTRGGWYFETVPNDGSNPQAFVNPEGNYVLIRNKDGRATVMTPEMARIAGSDNPRHLTFKLDQGDYDMNFIKDSWDNTESVNYNHPDTQARLLDNPDIPNGGHELDFPSSEMPADLQEEFGYSGPSVNEMLTNPDFGQATGPADVQTGVAGPIGAREAAQLGGKIFETDPTFTNVNMIPSAEVASPSTPAPKNYAGAEPTPLGFGKMASLPLGVAAGPNTGGLIAPTNAGVADGMTGAPSFRSRVEDAAMGVAGVGQKIGGAVKNMDPMTKTKIGMGLGAAAQFLPDIAAMRAMDDIQGPEALPFERLQLMNADIQVGNQMNQIDQASARAMAAADRNVSNPAVAAAMKRANQRIAAGQKANVLSNEAQVESQMRNQNMVLANDNMNRNRMLDYQNRQNTVNFENDKLAAKNRMRQQMGMKLGQVFGDFQNLNADANKFNLLSKMYDPSLMARNDIDFNSMFGYTNNNE
jgi:hypothetical protein